MFKLEYFSLIWDLEDAVAKKECCCGPLTVTQYRKAVSQSFRLQALISPLSYCHPQLHLFWAICWWAVVIYETDSVNRGKWHSGSWIFLIISIEWTCWIFNLSRNCWGLPCVSRQDLVAKACPTTPDRNRAVWGHWGRPSPGHLSPPGGQEQSQMQITES